MAEEHDTAIFAAGKRAKEAGEPVENNPYDPAFVHQNESWAAGWAEGEAPVVASAESDDDATKSGTKLGGRAKVRPASDD